MAAMSRSAGTTPDVSEHVLVQVVPGLGETEVTELDALRLVVVQQRVVQLQVPAVTHSILGYKGRAPYQRIHSWACQLWES